MMRLTRRGEGRGLPGESTSTLLARRATHYLYDRRVRMLQGRVPEHPFPGLTESLAMHLANRLPARVLTRLSVERLIAFSHSASLILARVAVHGYRLARTVRRVVSLAGRLPARLAPLPPQLLPVRILARLPVRRDHVTLGGVAVFHGWQVESDRLTTFFGCLSPIETPLAVVVHVRPAAPTALPDRYAVLGAVPLDAAPVVAAAAWRAGAAYRHETPLSGLPPGDYLLAVGLCDARTCERLAVPGSERNMITLGWIRTGGGARTQPCVRPVEAGGREVSAGY